MRWLPVLSTNSLSAQPPDAGGEDAGPPETALVEEAGGAAAAAAVPFEKRVYLEVFGCQMNKLDAELMVACLEEQGYRLTGDIRDAGVILYNTCAVREHAETRVFSKVGALRRLKERRPEVVVGVLGCSAQNHGEAIFRRYPHVGLLCGPGEFLRLPELIARSRRTGRVSALDLGGDVAFERRRNLGPSRHQAFVSVMRGCDMACTYCVVPRTRGPEVSRPVQEIVEEARALVAGGVRDITLLGQTVNSYGKGLAAGRRIGLHHVLEELDRIPGLDRVRFVTSHPRFMSPDLVAAMADLETVCEYLHLPVQSGSDAVLRRMRRAHDMDHYRRIVDACRERVPAVGLATDIIVGFCGETEDEFRETIRLMEEVRYQGAFIFKYSVRPGTRAAQFGDDVPVETKRERNQILLALQKRISLEIHRQAVG
ncbi:MAG: tRNA (N6-isopentenyl adenosine(37)-C2)-methylthiotransferase MiaB, partial [Planctomycetes bacterium]|nr:tRNA (N6-isopentenyl adenosine(37)-C2)-methylthiotransferase MiaB [Planctomycetota bacterium]